MLDASQPPVEQEPVEGDPYPCPEDEEFFVRPDVAGMEEAIGKFLDGLEGQERRGFEEMHRFLSALPVPTPQDSKGMTHCEALDGKFLPDLDEEQRKRFTPSELILYKHAQDYRYIGLYTSISLYIRVYTSIYCDIRLMLQVERR
jgi:hypothetical protein